MFEQSAQERLKIFLSYSRRDAAFMRRLADALFARGYQPDFDQASYDPDNIDTGISVEDEWWQRLQAIIAASDLMVFIVSPASAGSKVCDEEIAYARALGKRIIPILCHPIDFAKAPPRLSALNIKLDFSACDDDKSFASAVGRLCVTLDRDVTWYRESRRLTALSVRWHTRNQPLELLLGEADVNAIDRLLEQRPREAPEPSDILLALRDQSRAKLEAERKEQRRIIGRAFVKPALEALRNRKPNSALRIAAAGVLLANDLAFELVPELLEPVVRAISYSRVQSVAHGHSDSLTFASFSPDGKRIITNDGTARLWNAETARELAILDEGRICSASFSGSGELLLTRSEEATCVWDSLSGCLLSTLPGGDFAEFSPDRSTIVTKSLTVRLWDAKTGRELLELDPTRPGFHFWQVSFHAVSFSPDSKRLLTASEDKTARVWDIETGIEVTVCKGHDGPVKAACFSQDGLRIVTVSEDNTARVWDAVTGDEIAVLKTHTDANKGVSFETASFSQDGRRILTNSGDSAHLWDAATGRLVTVRTKGLGWFVTDAMFSPDGTRILTGGDEVASILDAKDGRQLAVLRGHTATLRSASFSTDGRRVVTASDDRTARLWDTETGHQLAVLEDHDDAVWTACFSHDGACVLTASHKTARVWSAETSYMMAIRSGPPSDQAYQVSFSKDARRGVYVGSDGDAHLIDAEAGLDIAVLTSLEYKIKTASFIQNDQRLATISDDNSIRLWDLTGRELATMKGHEDAISAVSLSPDSKRVVTASQDKTARIWDVETGCQLAVLAGHSFGVNDASFSPDGKQIVTASSDNSARLWSALTGHEMSVLRVQYKKKSDAYTGGVLFASFNPDGTRVMTVSSKGAVHLWRVEEPSKPVAFEAKLDSIERASFSLDGRRILTVSNSLKNASIWDVQTGIRRILLRGHHDRIWSASFSPDGMRVVTASNDGTRLWHVESGQQLAVLPGAAKEAWFSDDARVVTVMGRAASIWDVSRFEVMCRAPGLVLAAALSHGVGQRTEFEAADLLMETVPEDMFGEAKRQFLELDLQSDNKNKAELREKLLEQTTRDLRAPLDPSCYLSPSQLNERVGIDDPTVSYQREDAYSAAIPQGELATVDHTPKQRHLDALHTSPMGEQSLRDAEWLETIGHNMIYRLADGRYFVLLDVAMLTLEDARLVANLLAADQSTE